MTLSESLGDGTESARRLGQTAAYKQPQIFPVGRQTTPAGY